MSLIKNPHSDDPFTDPEFAAYAADRLRKHQQAGGDGYSLTGRGSQALQAARAEYAANAPIREEEARLLSALLSAIMGKPVEFSEAEFERQIWGAAQERARLLSQIERNTETLAVSAESVAAQQRLIQEMSLHSMRGKKAFDAFMLLMVRLGINPAPTDPEEAAAAILGVMDKLREELSSKQEV